MQVVANMLEPPVFPMKERAAQSCFSESLSVISENSCFSYRRTGFGCLHGVGARGDDGADHLTVRQGRGEPDESDEPDETDEKVEKDGTGAKGRGRGPGGHAGRWVCGRVRLQRAQWLAAGHVRWPQVAAGRVWVRWAMWPSAERQGAGRLFG